MTYENAKILLGLQDRNLRKINGTRFDHNGFEYRLTYEGGFASGVCIDRREIGRRNFKYFSYVGGWKCGTVNQLMDLIMEEINKKGKRK